MTKKKVLMLLALVAMFFLQWGLDSCTPENSHAKHTWVACSESSPTLKNVSGKDDLGGANLDYVLVDFEDDLTHEEIKALTSTWDLQLKPHSSEPVVDRNLYIAEVPEGSVPKIAIHFKGVSGIQSISEVHKVHSLGMLQRWSPADPLYQFQWHFEQIELEEAWTLSTGKGAIVAILDTGIQNDLMKHGLRDLANTRTVPGWDFVAHQESSYDPVGHGSHVAGTVAQSTHNAYGGSGVAYNASLMNVRVLGKQGGTSADVAAGIYFAADHGAHVINMSLGSSQPSTVIEEACAFAHKQGVTIVAAAGNDGNRTPGYPAAFPHVISVASTQYDQHPAPYSQWGPTVDIAAPGGNTNLDQNKDGKPDGVLQETVKYGQVDQHQFALYQGTSMAAPHVAGVAALINQWGITHPDRVEYFLKKSTEKPHLKLEDEESPESVHFYSDDENAKVYPEKEHAERYGAGVVQADSAVTQAIMETGLIRFGLALLLSILVFVIVRQQNLLEADVKHLASFVTPAILVSSGVFILPLIMPGMHLDWVSSSVAFMSTPLLAWDWILFGKAQTPLLANPVLPLLLFFGAYHIPRLRYLTAGICVGVAAFMLGEMVMLSNPLQWIPGGDWAARVYYLLSGGIILGIVSTGLYKESLK